ncbi:hypothetical protein F0562_021083 [Nyssa sinensis]|uniref:Auxin-responsive protein n=1 Tax=Nyssa sinensis TaxID=561372 RepID=A0A5J5BNY9_9ASTE|nr:hypothetical protein F0562_021083 [Nyssa sinensis]
MEGTLGLLGTGGGGGGGPSSGGSTTGSMSTVSKEDNLVLSSEVSSSYPDESELELGLGLGFGGGSALKAKTPPTPTPWGQYARILTAKDFPSLVGKASSSSSSSSSSSVTKANASAGTKRTADSVASAANGVSQVVGWPPIRSYRMNSLVNQIKSPTTGEFNSTIEKSRSKNGVVDKTNSGSDKNVNNAKEKGHIKTSLFVKVNMDGIPIGRKVDLNAHSCYETLAEKLEDMFCRPSTAVSARRSSFEEHDPMVEATGPSKLLDGSSEFVLTYEDKEGDWMLVGDVPWGMFLSSVKKLRIMRSSEVNGLAPRFRERNVSQRITPI